MGELGRAVTLRGGGPIRFFFAFQGPSWCLALAGGDGHSGSSRLVSHFGALMALLTVLSPTLSGITPVFTTLLVTGDNAPCSQNAALWFKNSTAAPITVTFATHANVAGLAVPNVTLVVPATSDRVLGPINPQVFSDPIDGLCHMTYSAVGLTAMVVGL